MKAEAYKNTVMFERDHWWYQGRRKIILSFMRRFLPVKRPLRILDVGCGTGLMAECFSEFGMAYGLDAVHQPSSYVRSKNRIIVGNSLDLPFKESIFDCIALLDVLEHIDDDVSMLEKISGYLSPGGILLLTVPAFEFLWSGEDYVSNHRRRYSSARLSEILRKSGFEIKKITYFNFFLFFPVALTILAKRFFVPKSLYQSNLNTIPPWINTVLDKIFSSEAKVFKFIPAFPFGACILAVAYLDTGKKLL